MKNHPGFIAALDQSGGSAPHALSLYGIQDGAWSNEEEMFAMVHQMRVRLAEILKLLAELAGMGACGAPPEVTGNDVDSCRRLISQKVEDALGLIESSKFEPGAPEVGEAEKLMGKAQIVLILLLTLARHRPGIPLPDAVRAAAQELDNAVATALLAVETQVVSGSQPAVPDFEDAMDALERSVDASTSAAGGTAADSYLS